jgi:hypothetical protein
MTEKFVPLEASEFYRNKGLKRVSVTLSDATIAFLEDKRQEFSSIKTTKQGDVVDAMVAAYLDKPQVAAAVDDALRKILDQKVMQKMGRKEGYRKVKPEDAE